MGWIFRGIRGGGLCAIGATLLLAAACDGSDDPPADGPDSGGTATDAAIDGVREACLAWCEKQAQAACPGGTPREQCPAQCDLLGPQLTCPKEYAATGDCIANKARFECTEAGNYELYGCWTEAQPFFVCVACQKSSSDDACDTCYKTSCCAQLKAYWGHPDLGPYIDCGTRCTEQDAGLACIQACGAPYSDLKAAANALGECRSTCAACP